METGLLVAFSIILACIVAAVVLAPCSLGLHRWEYKADRARRTCNVCGTRQWINRWNRWEPL